MTATPSAPECPVCDHELNFGETKCPNCGTDQRLFSPASELALDLYNDGLDLARTGDRDGAIEKLRGAIAADPSDVDAYIVLGKLLAQSKKPVELQEAIVLWGKAGAKHPTGEQTQKIARYISTAEASLHEIDDTAAAGQRSRFAAAALGSVLLAAACGVAGYMLHTPPAVASNPIPKAASHVSPPGARRGGPELSFAADHEPAIAGRSGKTPIAAADRNVATAAVPSSGLPAERPAISRGRPNVAGSKAEDEGNPVAAINNALRRPDIGVVRTGSRLALVGTVASVPERRLALAGAAYAARTTPDGIDASGLKVKPAYIPVGSARVQTMLNAFITGLGRNGWDPLTGAKVTVIGGAAAPLRIVGTCASPKARAEIVTLIKEIYPSAADTDVSGIKVQTVRMEAHRSPRKIRFYRRRRPHWPVTAGYHRFISLAESRRKQTRNAYPGRKISRPARQRARSGSK